LQRQEQQVQEPEQLLEQVPEKLKAGMREQPQDLLNAKIVVASAAAATGIDVAAAVDLLPTQQM
jgi:hypothetical protein